MYVYYYNYTILLSQRLARDLTRVRKGRTGPCSMSVTAAKGVVSSEVVAGLDLTTLVWPFGMLTAAAAVAVAIAALEVVARAKEDCREGDEEASKRRRRALVLEIREKLRTETAKMRPKDEAQARMLFEDILAEIALYEKDTIM